MERPKSRPLDDILFDLYPIAMVIVLAAFGFGLWKFIFSKGMEAFFK